MDGSYAPQGVPGQLRGPGKTVSKTKQNTILHSPASTPKRSCFYFRKHLLKKNDRFLLEASIRWWDLVVGSGLSQEQTLI